MILLNPNPRIPPRSSLSVASRSIPPMAAGTSPMACRELMAASSPITTQDNESTPDNQRQSSSKLKAAFPESDREYPQKGGQSRYHKSRLDNDDLIFPA